jgi:UDP-glucose 4-epimerase
MGILKKILLTGGAGYIGSHIAISLVEAGYEPIILDNFSNSDPAILDGINDLAGKTVSHYNADCNLPETFDEIVSHEGKIDGIIHLAAYKAVGESVQNPLKYYQNNLTSMWAMLDAMVRHKIPNLVFSSSCTVYGTPDTTVVTEESPIYPAFSPYGYTKQACERMMEDLHNTSANMKLISLRYFNPIGAHPSAKIGELPIGTPNNLVPFITQVAAGWREKIVVFGQDYDTEDGTCVRDYIHVVDLAKAHVQALDKILAAEGSSLEAFNIGTGQGTSVKEIIDIFQDVNDKKINVTYGDRRAGDVPSIYANADKSKNELNWEAQYTIEDCLKHAWKWQQTLTKPE